ncbi:transcriptional regulator [Pseudarthrobacter sulfonivorans]|uniref:Transcriptional regulator n=1 Tax=Pseudarthrobacter sulfonivorans TaxID=121292 RepID=A0A0U3PZR5_9MICC|nr:TetR/AcrR family transcriptional regulator [Pseudarthrobacter sulfonivorans]ALV39854.1 transcriptional regulator [Pseudarthrobacter sulfonivorans]
MDLERVQRAGVSLFATKGFAATGIRELGSAAGINSATLYHYVGSKEELLVSIMRACLEELIDSGAAAVRASSEPVLQLAGLVSSHVGLTAVNQLTARVAEYEMRALSEANRPVLQEMRDEYEGLFAQVLERGKRVGVFKTKDLAMARLAIMEMGTGVAHWYRRDGRLELPVVQRFFVDMACKILSVDPAGLDGFDYVHAPKRLPSEPSHIVAAEQRSRE